MLNAGDIVGGYRIESLVARGGMGVVYRAEQLGLQRTVALKVIAPEYASDVMFRARFEREARLAAQLDHPNVIPVHEAGEADGQLFIAMRFVRGRDLGAILAEETRLAPERAASLFTQIAGALDAAHAAGLVHRDVKPGNILVAAGSDGGEHAYLGDFGLTKDASSVSGVTGTGEWVGTVDYVAPEQLEGKAVDARTDIYSLGCLLYQSLSGTLPFTGTGVAKMFAHAHSPPPRLPGDRPELGAVVARAMAKDPDDRYPSAGDLGRAVHAALLGETVVSPERSVATGVAATGLEPAPEPPTVAIPPPDAIPPTIAIPPRSGNARRNVAIAAVSALIAVVIAAGIVLASGGSGGKETASTATASTATTSSSPSTAPTTQLAGAECESGLNVNNKAVTSCGFASNVKADFPGTTAPFTSLSPATGRTYKMTCTAETPHVCTPHGFAIVYFLDSGTSLAGATLPGAHCGDHADVAVQDAGTTSCDFAQSVKANYTENQAFNATSPTLGSVSMTCTSGSLHVCTRFDKPGIYFP